jgi:hypothetical protein
MRFVTPERGDEPMEMWAISSSSNRDGEPLDYAPDLRSISAGRADYTMWSILQERAPR